MQCGHAVQSWPSNMGVPKACFTGSDLACRRAGRAELPDLWILTRMVPCPAATDPLSVEFSSLQSL